MSDNEKDKRKEHDEKLRAALEEKEEKVTELEESEIYEIVEEILRNPPYKTRDKELIVKICIFYYNKFRKTMHHL